MSVTITAPIFTAYLATLDADAVREIRDQIAVDACEGAATQEKRIDRAWGSLPLEEAFAAAEARLAEANEKPALLIRVHADSGPIEIDEDTLNALRKSSWVPGSPAVFGTNPAAVSAAALVVLSLSENEVDRLTYAVGVNTGRQLLNGLLGREALFRAWTPADASEAKHLRRGANMLLKRCAAFA